LLAFWVSPGSKIMAWQFRWSQLAVTLQCQVTKWWQWFTCSVSDIILSNAAMKSSSSVHWTCFRPTVLAAFIKHTDFNISQCCNVSASKQTRQNKTNLITVVYLQSSQNRTVLFSRVYSNNSSILGIVLAGHSTGLMPFRLRTNNIRPLSQVPAFLISFLFWFRAVWVTNIFLSFCIR